MPTKKTATPGAVVEQAGQDGVNHVRLRGRVSQHPERRELPSGDQLWTFRLVVPREPRTARADGQRGPRGTVDALECAVWDARVRRSVATWRAGDVIEVEGALRRRFFRTGAGTVSRVEVDVSSGRLLRRGPVS